MNVITKTVKKVKKDSKRNRKLKNKVEKELKLLTNTRTGVGTRTSVNPVKLRKRDPKQALSALRLQQKRDLHDYMLALLHPDYAVRVGLNARIPSLIGSPTVTYRSHVNVQMSTGSTGAFLFRFLPGNMYQTSDDVVKDTVFNNTCTGIGTAGTNTLVSGFTYRYPAFAQRYRPVSALVRVSYNGSVLNQSGKLMGCYIFETSLTACGSTINAADANLDRYSSNFSLIRNGLWNNEVNVTKDADGIEMLYAPMDPNSQTYAAAGDGFHTRTTYSSSVSTNTVNGIDYAIPQFVIAGQNFPVNTNCISVDVFQLFEVIPDPTAAFFYNMATHSMDTVSYERIVQDFDVMDKTRDSTASSVRSLLTSGSKIMDKFLNFDLSDAISVGSKISKVGGSILGLLS